MGLFLVIYGDFSRIYGDLMGSNGIFGGIYW